MLYVFHGNNVSKSSEKAHSLINSLFLKKPDASFVTINADNWTKSIIEEHLGGQGLFSNKYVVFLDRISENNEAKEIILEFISFMHESSNIFIVLEGKLNIDLKKEFEKSAEKVIISDKEIKDKFETGPENFNIFSLADAIGSRDSIKSWAIYRKAIDSGLEVESIAGTIFWQLKSIILSKNAKSAKDAGLSPFVFNKSRKYAENYSEQELNLLTTSLIIGYHDGHRGIVNSELFFERMLLILKNCDNVA